MLALARTVCRLDAFREALAADYPDSLAAVEVSVGCALARLRGGGAGCFLLRRAAVARPVGAGVAHRFQPRFSATRLTPKSGSAISSCFRNVLLAAIGFSGSKTKPTFGLFLPFFIAFVSR